MGNKWQSHEAYINPADSPFKHIQETAGVWSYVPSTDGLTVELRSCRSVHPYDEQQRLESLEAPFLSSPEEIPPSPVSVYDRTHQVIKSLVEGDEPPLLEALKRHPVANLILLTHGRVWGMLPVELLREQLRPHVEAVSETVYAFGRGKRFAQHAFLISRDGGALPPSIAPPIATDSASILSRLRSLLPPIFRRK